MNLTKGTSCGLDMINLSTNQKGIIVSKLLWSLTKNMIGLEYLRCEYMFYSDDGINPVQQAKANDGVVNTQRT